MYGLVAYEALRARLPWRLLWKGEGREGGWLLGCHGPGRAKAWPRAGPWRPSALTCPFWAREPRAARQRADRAGASGASSIPLVQIARINIESKISLPFRVFFFFCALCGSVALRPLYACRMMVGTAARCTQPTGCCYGPTRINHRFFEIVFAKLHCAAIY